MTKLTQHSYLNKCKTKTTSDSKSKYNQNLELCNNVI